MKTDKVATETQAIIYLKQGNIEAAKKMFDRLSIKHPQKKAYYDSYINPVNP
jgi:hypothetical protein